MLGVTTESARTLTHDLWQLPVCCWKMLHLIQSVCYPVQPAATCCCCLTALPDNAARLEITWPALLPACLTCDDSKFQLVACYGWSAHTTSVVLTSQQMVRPSLEQLSSRLWSCWHQDMPSTPCTNSKATTVHHHHHHHHSAPTPGGSLEQRPAWLGVLTAYNTATCPSYSNTSSAALSPGHPPTPPYPAPCQQHWLWDSRSDHLLMAACSSQLWQLPCAHLGVAHKLLDR